MLFAASDFVARLVATLEGAGALTGGYALWITLSLLALALLQLALIGLYTPTGRPLAPSDGSASSWPPWASRSHSLSSWSTLPWPRR